MIKEIKPPKSVKAYLKLCLQIAYTDRDELKGIGKLTPEEYEKLGDIRCAVQNDLGDSTELLDKHKLKYNSSTKVRTQ